MERSRQVATIYQILEKRLITNSMRVRLRRTLHPPILERAEVKGKEKGRELATLTTKVFGNLLLQMRAWKYLENLFLVERKYQKRVPIGRPRSRIMYLPRSVRNRASTLLFGWTPRSKISRETGSIRWMKMGLYFVQYEIFFRCLNILKELLLSLENLKVQFLKSSTTRTRTRMKIFEARLVLFHLTNRQMVKNFQTFLSANNSCTPKLFFVQL